MGVVKRGGVWGWEGEVGNQSLTKSTISCSGDFGYVFSNQILNESRKVVHTCTVLFFSFPVMRAKQRFESAAPLPPPLFTV